MSTRSYNRDKPVKRGSRKRPDLFTSPKHCLKHGTALSEKDMLQAMVRYGDWRKRKDVFLNTDFLTVVDKQLIARKKAKEQFGYFN